MIIWKLWKRVVIAGIVVMMVLPGISFAAVQNVTIKAINGTLINHDGSVIPDGSGFVQVIKGDPENPPRAVPIPTNGYLSGSDAYAVAQYTPYTGWEIKGTVGAYPDTPAGDGGFFLDNRLDHPISTSYYMRYWTTDGYYGNSTSITPWAAGEPVPADMTFGGFTLYLAGPPAAPGVSATLSGYNLDLKPMVTVSITAPTNTQLANVRGGKYHFEVREGSWTIGAVVIAGDTNSTSFSLSPASALQFGRTYYVGVYARNYFADGPYTVADPPVVISEIGETPQSFTLTLESGTPAKPGINFFAMPFAGPWYAFQADRTTPVTFTNYGGVSTNQVVRVYDLAKAVNRLAGGNVVSTFGKWNSDPAVQKDVGILVLGTNPDSTATEPGQTQNVTTRLKNLALKQGEGYQIYSNAGRSLTLVIKNTP